MGENRTESWLVGKGLDLGRDEERANMNSQRTNLKNYPKWKELSEQVGENRNQSTGSRISSDSGSPYLL